MMIEVKISPKSRKNSVEEFHGKLFAHVTAPAVGGRANIALIELLAKHFGVKKSKIRIVSGLKSRDKVVEVLP